jgi:hypothetical protein
MTWQGSSSKREDYGRGVGGPFSAFHYPEPVRLEIYTTAAKDPSDVTLSPGQNIIYRDPSISVRSITVIASHGDTKTYDSASLESIAGAAHQKMETIQWSISPEGISASSP